jgi:hypothetical protein
MEMTRTFCQDRLHSCQTLGAPRPASFLENAFAALAFAVLQSPENTAPVKNSSPSTRDATSKIN